jgi:hypothetical protein
LNSKLPKKIVEEVKISFTGLDTDKGVIDVRDLARALNGWSDFWQISTSVYLNKDLSTKHMPQDIRPKIRIRGFERRSFDVLAIVVIPLTLMVSYDLAKALWKWRRSLLKRHVDSKKKFMTREEAIEALKLLAKDYDIEATKTIEIVKVMDMVDDALNDLVEPIDRSAKKVILTSSSAKSTIQLTSNEKMALKSGSMLIPRCARKALKSTLLDSSALIRRPAIHSSPLIIRPTSTKWDMNTRR